MSGFISLERQLNEAIEKVQTLEQRVAELEARNIELVRYKDETRDRADELFDKLCAAEKRVAELEDELANQPQWIVDAKAWGYAACEADVVTHCMGREGRATNRSLYIANEVKAGKHRGAAARKNGGKQ